MFEHVEYLTIRRSEKLQNRPNRAGLVCMVLTYGYMSVVGVSI